MASKVEKLELIYGKETAKKILACNVLVVGAGGIGCEVMKTLSVTGFKRVTVVSSSLSNFRLTWTLLMSVISTGNSSSEESMLISLRLRFFATRSSLRIRLSKCKPSSAESR